MRESSKKTNILSFFCWDWLSLILPCILSLAHADPCWLHEPVSCLRFVIGCCFLQSLPHLFRAPPPVGWRACPLDCLACLGDCSCTTPSVSSSRSQKWITCTLHVIVPFDEVKMYNMILHICLVSLLTALPYWKRNRWLHTACCPKFSFIKYCWFSCCMTVACSYWHITLSRILATVEKVNWRP